MKKLILITTVLFVTAFSSAHAQEISKDSINSLKQEKGDLKIRKRLNENKIKLAKLQNMVRQKTDDVSSTAKDAQNAATNNKESAEKLSSNSQDKKLARQSRKSARKANRAAKSGRNATEDLNDLQSDIAKLKKQIAEDEAKLGIAPSMPK